MVLESWWLIDWAGRGALSGTRSAAHALGRARSSKASALPMRRNGGLTMRLALSLLTALAAGTVVLAQPSLESAELPAAPRARIDAAIDRALAEHRVVGAVVLVAHEGKLVYQRAAGFADREAQRPMQIDTLFRLSSVSKPIVSAAALALVDRGKLALDDSVTKWLPAFRPKLASGELPAITVRQLLSHTSGLGYRFAEAPGAPARVATPYYDAKPAPARMADPQSVPYPENGRLTFSPSRALDPKAYPSGGAGMVGSAPDLARFLEAIRAGGAPVLSSTSAASMMRNQIGSLSGPQPGIGFGFGGAVVVDPRTARTPQSPGTWMWGGVYGHSWFVDPERKLTVVAFTNTALEGMWGRFTTDLRDAVYESVK